MLGSGGSVRRWRLQEEVTEDAIGGADVEKGANADGSEKMKNRPRQVAFPKRKMEGSLQAIKLK